MKKEEEIQEKILPWLVSSCLVGLKTRYDGKVKVNESCLQFLVNKLWVPVCPEQLGGFPTPRVPAAIQGGTGFDVLLGKASVITVEGGDVSEGFVQGAAQVLRLVEMQNIAGMCVKSRSPSCGLHGITGVTSALLLKYGVILKEF